MHRDISPDNIFIDREGRVILIDFGAARQELREKSRRECQPCTGTGEIARVKTVTINLPAGVSDGARYRLKGQGGAGVNGGPDGDLFLTVRLKMDAVLKRKQHKSHLNGIEKIYMIDHQSGSIRLSDLPIGAGIYDPTWEWEFRTGDEAFPPGLRPSRNSL